jgi:hypothetical protein
VRLIFFARRVLLTDESANDHLARHRVDARRHLIAVDGGGLPDRGDHPDRVMARVAAPSDLFTNRPR